MRNLLLTVTLWSLPSPGWHSWCCGREGIPNRRPSQLHVGEERILHRWSVLLINQQMPRSMEVRGLATQRERALCRHSQSKVSLPVVEASPGGPGVWGNRRRAPPSASEGAQLPSYHLPTLGREAKHERQITDPFPVLVFVNVRHGAQQGLLHYRASAVP